MDRDTFREMRESGANAPPPASETKPPMTNFNPSDFKAGDWVEVVVMCDGLEKLGLKKGDRAQVDYVTTSFVHLLPRSTVGGFFAWRFAPAPAPAPQVQSAAPEKPDAVFRPNHYARLWPEPITVINAWKLGFNLGNAVKYIARAGHKDSLEQDLKKAIRYLEIELECVRRNKAVTEGADKATLIETL